MDSVRNMVRKVMRSIAKAINSMSGGRITPNMITVVGLFAHVGIAYLIAIQEYYWSAGLLVFFGLFDVLDGELARLQKNESRFGMFFDSLTDRIKEVLLYISAGYSLVAQGDVYWAIWAISACGAALLVSYTNAWGEAVLAGVPKTSHTKNKTFRGGIMGFEVRMSVLVLGLLTGWLEFALVVITIGGLLTTLQRSINVKRKLSNVQS